MTDRYEKLACKCGHPKEVEIGEGTLYCCECKDPVGTVTDCDIGRIMAANKLQRIRAGSLFHCVTNPGMGMGRIYDEFTGSKIDHGIAMSAMDLQARVDQLTAENNRLRAENLHLKRGE